MGVNIAVFASGRGTNALAIIKRLEYTNVHVGLIVSSKVDAGVLNIANDFNISTHVMLSNNDEDNAMLLGVLQKHQIKFIVLAGYLRLVKPVLIKEFENRIINIHPSLLPKYGGKGFYGDKVHKAVIENNETESGITIHYVNSKFDEGEIIEQHSTMVNQGDTPKSLAENIHKLEHKYFPEVVYNLAKEL